MAVGQAMEGLSVGNKKTTRNSKKRTMVSLVGWVGLLYRNLPLFVHLIDFGGLLDRKCTSITAGKKSS